MLLWFRIRVYRIVTLSTLFDTKLESITTGMAVQPVLSEMSPPPVFLWDRRGNSPSNGDPWPSQSPASFGTRFALKISCHKASPLNFGGMNHMDADEDYQDYLLELREHVCSHCVERQPDCPPCTPHGKACGIELHLPELVSICRTTDDVQMDTYTHSNLK